MTHCGPPGYLTRSHLPEFQDLISNSAFFDVWRAKNADAKRMSLTRRALLKTTAHALVGWIALAIVLSARISGGGWDSGLHVAGVAWRRGPRAVGLREQPREDKGQQTADLLRRARQAMAENDLGAADSLISQAEALGVQYNIFYMGDTPKKARRDLERQTQCRASPAKPSQLFSPLGSNENKKAPSHRSVCRPRDRSARRRQRVRQVTPLPRRSTASPIAGADAFGSLSATTGQRRLRTASTQAPSANRRNPAATEPIRFGPPGWPWPSATSAAPASSSQQARAMRLNYQPLDDTPDKVESGHPQVPGTFGPRQEHRSLRPQLCPQYDGTGRRA